MTTKLIRDRIPEIAASRGQQLQIHRAPSSEMANRLLEKLDEETIEVTSAGYTEGLLDELADVLEVVYAITRFSGWTLADLEQARVRKHAERGGFDRRLVLTTSDDQCEVEFSGGGRCSKPSGHRSPGSGDPHTP